jgi:hypothetical protein
VRGVKIRETEMNPQLTDSPQVSGVQPGLMGLHDLIRSEARSKKGLRGVEAGIDISISPWDAQLRLVNGHIRVFTAKQAPAAVYPSYCADIVIPTIAHIISQLIHIYNNITNLNCVLTSQSPSNGAPLHPHLRRRRSRQRARLLAVPLAS